MDTIEQKEKDTIELRKLTKFQKKQVLSLVDRFLEENEESKKKSFPAFPKCGKAHPVLIEAGKTKGGNCRRFREGGKKAHEGGGHTCSILQESEEVQFIHRGGLSSCREPAEEGFPCRRPQREMALRHN